MSLPAHTHSQAHTRAHMHTYIHTKQYDTDQTARMRSMICALVIHISNM